MEIKRSKEIKYLTSEGERLLKYCEDIVSGDCKYHIKSFDELYFEPLEDKYTIKDIATFNIFVLSQYEKRGE